MYFKGSCNVSAAFGGVLGVYQTQSPMMRQQMDPHWVRLLVLLISSQTTSPHTLHHFYRVYFLLQNKKNTNIFASDLVNTKQ